MAVLDVGCCVVLVAIHNLSRYTPYNKYFAELLLSVINVMDQLYSTVCYMLTQQLRGRLSSFPLPLVQIQQKTINLPNKITTFQISAALPASYRYIVV